VNFVFTVRVETPNEPSSGTAAVGKLSNATVIIEFHGSVKTEGAVAVGSGAMLGVWRNLREQRSHKRTMQMSISGANLPISVSAFGPRMLHSLTRIAMSMPPRTRTSHK
jgi:hypothetical protein